MSDHLLLQVPEAEFVDDTGTKWSTRLSVGTAERVLQQTKVDLLDAFDGKLFQRLADDVVTLARVSWWIVQPEAEKRTITDLEFAERFAGDTIERALLAVVGGVIRFFPSAKRNVLATLWATMRAAMSKADDKLTAIVTGPKVAAAVDRALAEAERRTEAELAAIGHSTTTTTTAGQAES